MTILMTGGDKIPPEAGGDDDEEFDPEWSCTWCGGDGWMENDDPLWHGFDKDEIPCSACNGTGLRKHQTIF